ncbi:MULTISPECIES: hypothetical protein [Enterobacter cloacae complex]|uniref:hypothetical protein n=1 Tax=Enterobacter cloacae complex TaxID=354276 RepID=UPI001F5B112E|nr:MULTISPECIES: hypothetical protein [Enterobacter cloacae complex]
MAVQVEVYQPLAKIPVQGADRHAKLNREPAHIQRFPRDQTADYQRQPDSQPVMATNCRWHDDVSIVINCLKELRF